MPACSIESRPEQRWIGPLTPASQSALCPASKGVLLMREGKVTFTPDEGTWVLDGTASPDGTVQASRNRNTSDKKVYNTELKAHWTEAAVDGTYTTPRCSYRVALKQR